MFGFLFGVIVGALGFWAYTFWKGGDDTSWDQSFSSSTGSNSYGSYSSEPVGTSTTSEGSTTPSTNP